MLPILIAMMLAGEPASEGATLSGVVEDAAGKPLPKASVFIRTAAPRQGVGVLCPSCYPDCVKSAVTDSQGRFAFTDLDRDLVFRLLAVAEGHVPAQSEKAADPKAGPVKFALKPRNLDKRDPALVLRGRVFDEAGEPISGVIVEPFAFCKGNIVQFGGLKGFDSLATTNAKGEFLLGMPESDVTVCIQASAPFKAPRRFQKLSPGPKAHDLTLCTGVTITGRLLKDGKPLPGVGVGAAQVDRDASAFLGPFQAATNADGVFAIRNVPSDDRLVLYGLMDSLRKHGAIAVREFATGPSESAVKVGDIAVTAGHKLTGTVVLSDGKPLPAGTRVMLALEKAWDFQYAVVGAQGGFAFSGLPSETYILSSRVHGYHLSRKNASRDPANGSRLLGTIAADIEGLRLVLEPGPNPPMSAVDVNADIERLRKSPLRGAPALK